MVKVHPRDGKRRQQGAAAVEFALVLPVLLMILFAIIDYGWYFVARMALQHAVYQGARAGVEARDWAPYDENPEELARNGLREAFWLDSGNADEDDTAAAGAEIEELPADEEDPWLPRRLRVKVSDFPYRSLSGYLPARVLPQTLSAQAILAFP